MDSCMSSTPDGGQKRFHAVGLTDPAQVATKHQLVDARKRPEKKTRKKQNKP